MPVTSRKYWVQLARTAEDVHARRLRDEQGKCIVFSTHIMQEVERLCDHVVVMAGGRTVADGSVAQLCQRAGSTDFEQAFVALAFAGQP